MIIVLYGFLSNVNRSSVNVFVTTMNSSYKVYIYIYTYIHTYRAHIVLSCV